MIGFERSTKNERDVLREALATYEAKQQARMVRERDDRDRSAAEWRRYQAHAILDHLGPE